MLFVLYLECVLGDPLEDLPVGLELGRTMNLLLPYYRESFVQC